MHGEGCSKILSTRVPTQGLAWISVSLTLFWLVLPQSVVAEEPAPTIEHPRWVELTGVEDEPNVLERTYLVNPWLWSYCTRRLRLGQFPLFDEANVCQYFYNAGQLSTRPYVSMYMIDLTIAGVQQLRASHIHYQPLHFRGVDLRDVLNLRARRIVPRLDSPFAAPGVDFDGADLRDASLPGADLRFANFYQANLRDADLRATRLHGAQLQEAILCGADLRQAVISTRTGLSKARFDDFTKLPFSHDVAIERGMTYDPVCFPHEDPLMSAAFKQALWAQQDALNPTVVFKPPTNWRALGRQLQHRFNKASYDCPKNLIDIQRLRRISLRFRRKMVRNPDIARVDVSPLITSPRGPYSVSCGYNDTRREWFRTTFHCVSQDLCFGQGDDKHPHDQLRFERSREEPHLWIMTRDRFGQRSYRHGGDYGDIVLIPLAEGVHLMVSRSRAREFYHGLIFTQRTGAAGLTSP